MDCMKNGFVEGLVLDGRYESISPLNQGSFGMVFLAKDITTGDLVAVKCLSKASATKDCPAVDIDENSVELVCHDRLGNHPNIVNLLHSFETKGHIFLVLEYCSMGDLYEAIRLGRGPLQTENVRDFMLQLVGAVEFMHSKGLYHRDIKPENLFLAQDGSMKLGDLGLATSDARSHEACVGSDRYMAPEQYDPQENGYSPAKADAWAIGICLLNVLFSRNPFVTPTESDKLFSDFARDNQALFDIFPNMSSDTFEVLVHAMAIDPAKRSLSALRDALERVVSFTTDEEALDDFCTEAREVAPASANREPLRTPSISSPQMDQSGTFPWSKALHMSPHRRQLSAIADTESYTEDLFPASERDRNSWYSMAQNSSLTSGLDSTQGASLKSVVLQPPSSRNLPRSDPVTVPSSLPSRMTSLSSVFGKKNTVSKSWTDIWDEDEEEEFVQHEDALEKRREYNSRTWSQESKGDNPILRRSGLSEIKDSSANARTPRPKPAQLATTDNVSDSDVFLFEDPAARYSPPSKRPIAETPTPTNQTSVMDKWAALGNRRRQYNQSAESLPIESSRKKTISANNWRTAFGLKVFPGNGSWNGAWNGAWDRSNRKENAVAKVRDWRRDTHTPQTSRDSLGDDLEWVGGP
jgi:serine/threonine protein kinase